MDSRFLQPPDGMATIGDSHGDIAVSPSGEIYVSVEGGPHAGIQVYSAQGRYLRNVPNAPTDFHGFIIASGRNGAPAIYGASLRGQAILQMTLSGEVTLRIAATSIPDQYKTSREGRLEIYLTGVAVAPNGDIYAVDGYGRDYIHRFDRTGRYLSTFGGRGDPWDFMQCHKIAIDPRFRPARLWCTDRLHDRLVQMDLNGGVLSVLAGELRWPSALAVFKDELAVGELGGRVSVFDRRGRVIARMGANERADEVKTNVVPPDRWRPEVFYAPHGIAYGKNGNLLVTEWNRWGRVVRLLRH